VAAGEGEHGSWETRDSATAAAGPGTLDAVYRSVPTRLWAWSGLGLAGSLLTALAAPRALSDPVVGWWYHPGFPGSRQLAVTLVWAGIALLTVAWLGVALIRRGDERSQERAAGWLTARRAAAIGLVWAIPLALAPPLFSRDVYSYLAQGTILHLGHDPYRQAPVVLAGLHRGHTLAAVSPFWRHTTAPYGPLFLELVSLIVGISGQHLVTGVLLCRALDLIGLGLVALQVPRLARALNGSAGHGVWLAVASPLVLFGLVAAGHNDLLMTGLLLAGVAFALRGNPLLGVAVCALAATIKVPALVGAIFIAVCWARAETGTVARFRFCALCALIVVGVLGVVTVASGVGLGWLSAAVFSTPAKVRLAITPSTAVGYTAASLLRDAGVAVSAKSLEAAFGLITTAVVACVGLGLLARARIASLVWLLGVTLLLAAAGGPAAWPWYLTWGLLLLCAAPGPQRSLALLTALAVGGLLVKPGGDLAIPRPFAPAVLIVYLLLAGAAWAWRSRARRTLRAGLPPSALART
jgi:alpha-1,6-mannosyltransferase